MSELEALGARHVRAARGGAEFEGDRRLGYASCLWLRSAIRVQLELRRDRVRSERELYDFVRAERCEDFIGPEQTVAVDASLRDSFLTHSQYAAQLVKDAVVDRFRDRTGTRPSVDREEPDLPLRLLLRRDEAVLYADLAGRSLHKRGYRDVQVKSPLSEAIAAGLLLLSDWDRRSPLLDPMCGSATFAIEAAWLAADRAPGLGRSFAFEKWVDLDQKLWGELFDDAEARAERGLRDVPPILGRDRHAGAISVAERSARAAGVRNLVDLRVAEVSRAVAPAEVTTVVTNPPYGERLGEGQDLEDSWRGLGEHLRGFAAGSVAWVLSGNPELTRFLRLRADRKVPVHNGPIDCRFVRYALGPS
ncbi:MAG: THUMP domain-containing protein [Planctomycetota bacterium]|nr:THUMP domain-containing protein [Planctomycetota bacterium]